jgi:hypothetical protein
MRVAMSARFSALHIWASRVVAPVLVVAAMAGCASARPEPPKTEALIDAPQLTIRIPDEKGVDATVFTSLAFRSSKTGPEYAQHSIRIGDKKADSFAVERKVDNRGIVGSGVLYTVKYKVEKNKDEMVFKFQPVTRMTYQEGVVMPFAIPSFSVDDLLKYLATNEVRLEFEIDSEYGRESTYANFIRMTTPARADHRTDDMTGRHENMRTLRSKYGEIDFIFKVFQYRNGSKTVINVFLPGSFTSPGEVDFGVIIKEIKAQLSDIVNS